MINKDIAFCFSDNGFTLRVGAIIINNQKLLMIKHKDIKGYYSVGGKVKYNETTIESIEREVLEEIGQPLKVKRLSYIHEYFYKPNDSQNTQHEICFYYIMSPLVGSELTNANKNETLTWLPLVDLGDKIIYPKFFKTELLNESIEVKHIIENLLEFIK